MSRILCFGASMKKWIWLSCLGPLSTLDSARGRGRALSMSSQAVYTTFEISRFLAVDITTVMAWTDQGKLSAYKTPGGHRRVPGTDLLAFLLRYKMPVPQELQKGSRRVLLVDDDE